MMPTNEPRSNTTLLIELIPKPITRFSAAKKLSIFGYQLICSLFDSQQFFQADIVSKSDLAVISISTCSVRQLDIAALIAGIPL